jgi:chromosome partitioning protein
VTRTKFVFIGGSKGGVGKSSTSHLVCLGAILRSQPASYVLTDPTRKIRGEGRPYSVLDGREPRALASIMSAARSTTNGWLVIDGGGNRPAFDAEIAAEADLCLLPFRASEEDLDTVASDMQRLPHALAWPTAWPTNSFAVEAAQFYIDGLAKAFPLRVITTPIPFVNSVSDLLAASLGSPSTPVRSVARKAFDTVDLHFDDRVAAAAESVAV